MKNNSLFNLEQDKTKSEETTLAGLAVYFELLNWSFDNITIHP